MLHPYISEEAPLCKSWTDKLRQGVRFEKIVSINNKVVFTGVLQCTAHAFLSYPSQNFETPNWIPFHAPQIVLQRQLRLTHQGLL